MSKKRPSLQAPATYAARAAVAKALAHPSRLLILDALAGGECCVGELAGLVGADQSTVSKPLALPKQVGLVVDRRAGTLAQYRLCCPCLPDFWRCLDEVLAADVAGRSAALCTVVVRRGRGRS